MTVIVAVDGPAGSGKSSVSRAAAKRLGFSYLDTGAGYRCVTWLARHRGVDLGVEAHVVALVREVTGSAPLDPEHQNIVLDGVDVTAEIREEAVTSQVSQVASYPSVREALNDGFRRVAKSVTTPGIIIEGRDITTVVVPDAPVRVLLTASEEVRMSRRALDLGSQESSVTMLSRDKKDSAVVDFMTPAAGVYLLDSTSLGFDDTVQALLDRVAEVYSVKPGGENV
jgi:cytidylate kinase